jgi:hypothetical protein
MALNVISLVFVGLVAFCKALDYGFDVCGNLGGCRFFPGAGDPILRFQLRYLGFSDAITMLNSNFGFFVHCYFSQTYRDGSLDVINAAKKKLRNFCCCKIVLMNQQVVPDQSNAWS